MKLFSKICIVALILCFSGVFSAWSNPLETEKNKFSKAHFVLPTATILGTTTVCQNASSPVITFTGIGGVAPYTFTYTVTGTTGNQTIQTTGTNSIVNLSAPTGAAGTFTYSLISVEDSSTGHAPINVSGNATVTINPQPSANLSSSATADTFNGFPVFKVCSNQATQIDFFNASTTISSNTNYTIDWGDGPPNFTGTSWTTLSHNYTVGLWTLLYTINGQNGCNITKTYKVFIGNNPAVGLGNPGNTDICISSALTFPITGTDNNPPGTTYTVTFNDGSLPVTFNHPPPTSVTHTFLMSSCGATSTSGSTTYQNSFFASIAAINPCDQSSASVVPIRISTAPVANFSTPPTVKCTNSQICLTNTSTGGDSATSTSCSTPKLIWSIVPNTGFTLASGSLGNDNGSTNTNAWVSGSTSICPTFSIPGNYSITLKIGSRCGVDQITKTICIEPPLVPLFTLNATTGCAPFSVTATNNTVLTNSCSPPTYLWQVTHTPLYCASSTVTIPNQTTQNATYNFTESGTYAIKLTMSNSCGSVNSTQVVTVKKPPTVTLNNIANFCQSTTLLPTSNVGTCTNTTPTYLWSFPGGTPSSATTAIPPSVSYSTTGNYSVTLAVTNECGTTTATSNTFAVLSAPIVQNETTTVCSGSAFSVTPSTSTAGNIIPVGTTYSWSVPTVTGGMTGGAAGSNQTSISGTLINSSSVVQTATYTVTPKLGTCLGSTFTVIVTINPAPSFASQPLSNTVCQGATITPLSVLINSSSGTPLYQWYSNTANNTSTGTPILGETNSSYTPPTTTIGTVYYYCVITLSSGGCSSLTSAIANITVTPTTSIATQPISNQDICVGVSIPSALTVNYSGGTGTASYQWYSNTSNSSTGGTAIAGAVNSSYTPPVFNSLGTFYYYVEVTLSGNGCGSITSSVATINVFADPAVSSQPLVSQTLCQGATPNSLDVVATGGNGVFSYQWYSNTSNNTTSGTLITGATSSSYIPNTSNVGTVYYYCVIKQPSTLGCSVISNTSAVVVNASPTITTQPSSSTVCFGGTPTLLTVAYTNGVGIPSYQWYSNTTNNNTTGVAITGETNASFLPPATSVGIIYYYCIISLPSSGGCSSISSNTATVTINAGATFNSQPTVTQNLCVGTTITIPLSASYVGGTGSPTYQWYSNTSNSTIGGTLITGANSLNFTPPVFLTPGTFYYYVVVTLSGNGCGPITSDVAEIVVFADPIMTIQPLASQIVCQNVAPTPLSVNAAGGIGSNYTYQWYSNTINSTGSGTLIPGETNSSYIPLTSAVGTTYYYCVINQINGLGCNVTSSIAEVIVNLAPTFTSQPISSTICQGGTPTLLSVTYANGVGVPQYQWYSNTVDNTSTGVAIAGATNATYSPPVLLSSTNYYYCIISLPSGGCSSITSNTATVIVNTNPVIASSNVVICSGTAFTITPNATTGDIVPTGTTYTWINPIVSPTGTVTGALAELTPQTSISQVLTNSTTSPSTVTYIVSPISGACPGADFTVVVTVNPSISPNVTVNNNTCYGVNNASIQTNITGGIPFGSGAPYNISWTGPNSFTSNATSISSLVPGVYTLSINDAGGCPISNNYTITEPNDIVINTDFKNDITCFGDGDGGIALTTTGGTIPYSYSWTKNSLPFSNSEDLSNLSPGNYTVTVTDVNLCGPKTTNFTITEPPVLSLNLVNQTNVLCYGDATGAISVVASGGTPILPGVTDYNYSWTGPSGFVSSNQNLNNIIAGTYNLTITDAHGCNKNLSVTLTQNPEIIITPTITPITCYGANNASISLALSGGISPYQTSWSNLASGTFQNNLSAGVYVITVTDALGCIKTISINIPEALLFTVNPIVKNISCYGANDGSINLNFVGGIPAINLTWSDGSTAGTTRNNLPPGTYSVTIIDGTPCTIMRTFTIVEPQPLVLSANLTNAFDCNNANSGAIDLIVSGGTPPFSYSWSNGAITEDQTTISAGNYFVTVTDANGCIKTAQYVISRQPPINIAVTTQTDFNCETHYVSQNFVAQVSGGIPPYQLQWSSGTISGANNEIMHTDTNGTVLLTVTDSHGCIATYTVDVTTPILGYSSFDTTSFGYTTYGLYSIGDPIQFQSNVTGDYTSISWDFGDGTFSTELNPTHTYNIAKDYVIKQTVTYPFGCIYVQTISLIVENGYVLVVPTAFTPNNDGLNDTFRPVTKALKNIQLDIYDTWGSLIYSETGDVLKGWDAKIKGISAENGNYYSKVSGKTFYGTIVNSNQTFVLIK